MEELSNFRIEQLYTIVCEAQIAPSCIQILTHSYFLLATENDKFYELNWCMSEELP